MIGRQTESRGRDLRRFYSILQRMSVNGAGPLRLSDCTGRMTWPRRGVYFFFEPGQDRSDSGTGPRVVRVGTHALKVGSRSSLWQRLSQHKGPQATSGGNHRGSIFRLLVGAALLADVDGAPATWGQGSTAPRDMRALEAGVERQVSEYIGRMHFIWLPVKDDPGPDSDRGVIERNAIALLSNFGRLALDPPTPDWLGSRCPREKVRVSGLWNQNHVDESYDPAFLDLFVHLAGAGR